MSKTWEVTLPIAGTAYITVEADSEEQAIEKALGEAELAHLHDWEALEKIVQGNVCYAPTWEASAECVDD